MFWKKKPEISEELRREILRLPPLPNLEALYKEVHAYGGYAIYSWFKSQYNPAKEDSAIKPLLVDLFGKMKRPDQEEFLFNLFKGLYEDQEDIEKRKPR